MLFTQDLEELIFHRHELYDTDEFIVLSGYLGPKPVKRLDNLPFRTKVIYGMYGSEGIKPSLHNSLIGIHNSTEKVNIFYSNLPVHSKCYIWKKRGEIIHALIGSANFSVNGLTTPFREVLAETTHDTFRPLNEYVNHVLNNSISCLEVGQDRVVAEDLPSEYCIVTLLAKDGEVQPTAGLNWGQNPNNNTRPNDAYITIRASHLRNYPNLFPPKQLYPMNTGNRGKGRSQRQNHSVEIIWDDEVTMEGLLEGTYPIGDVIYPKQISSFPVKSELGEYIRKRIGVASEQPVRKRHLVNYGRTDIRISLLSDGVYYFDFSV